MTSSRPSSWSASRRTEAFTLAELLTVIAIIALLMVFVVPATSSILSGFNLSQHGQNLADQFSLCRQLAMTRNRDAEIRFVEVSTDFGPTWAYQIWTYDEQGNNPKPYGAVEKIPDNIRINEELSPLMDLLPTGTANFPALGGNREYHALRYRVNGTALGSFGTQNYLTLSLARDDQEAPRNFYTVQVNPVTGMISIFRP